MDLLEYQAKTLFHEMGIPVLPSQRIDQPKDLKGLKIPYPVVLKSQVRRGGRGRAGGIKFVENTIDAIAAAQTIFNLPIMDEYPEVLLAEAKYDADQEFYLAVALDSSARRPVLLGSQQGGIGVAAAIAQMQQVIVDQEFSPFYARRLALKMGLQGHLIQSVSNVVQKMYQLFASKDLDLVEINPLGISANGEVMALDGKVTVNDSAIGRHPDLEQLTARIGNGRNREGMTEAKRSSLLTTLPQLVELDGNIGILCNGAGLTMTTLDLVHQAGGKPGNFLNVGGEAYHSWSLDALPIRVRQGLELVTQNRNIRVVLVNILGGVTSCQEIAQAIRTYLQTPSSPYPRQNPAATPQFVVRLMGQELGAAQATLAKLPVLLMDTLDEAVTKAVALAKPTGRNSA